VPVDQQWVRDVARHNRQVVDVDFRDVVYDVNTAASGHVCRFHNPEVAFGVRLLQSLEMLVKFSKLIRDHVSVRQEVERCLSKPVLHPVDVDRKLVFSSQFERLREMINLLILVQTFVKVAFASTAAPEDIPLVGLSVGKPVSFKHGTHQFGVPAEYFI